VGRNQQSHCLAWIEWRTEWKHIKNDAIHNPENDGFICEMEISSKLLIQRLQTIQQCVIAFEANFAKQSKAVKS
jgi:hypothetical protein